MSIMDLPPELLDMILLQYVMGVRDRASPMWQAAHNRRWTRDVLDCVRKNLFLRRVCKRFQTAHDGLRPFRDFVAVAEGRLWNAHMKSERPMRQSWTTEKWRARTITCPAERLLVEKTPEITPDEVDKQLMRGGECPAAHWRRGAPTEYDPQYSPFQISVRILVARFRSNKRNAAKGHVEWAEYHMANLQKHLERYRAELVERDRACAEVALRHVYRK
jgi:hypothetical protein